MKPLRSSSRARARAFDAHRTLRDSHILPAVSDALLGLGIVSGGCAISGLADDLGDSVALAVGAVLFAGIGMLSRAKLVRRPRPTTSAVLSGLAATWLVLVVVGAAVYLITGTIQRVDDAFVESAAGFSTTAVTTLNPTELSVPMTLWRASTQWFGGLVGIVAGVVALPTALQQKRLAPTEWIANDDFARNKRTRRRQIVAIYLSLTALIGVAFAATGMGTKHSAVHALTTISTGGFSSAPDSFASFGAAAAAVATVGMIIAGASYAVVWWAIRGRAKALVRSPELRAYGAVLLVGTLLVWWRADELSWHDSLFTIASSVSTTGFAVTDWTTLDHGVVALLLVIIATGSMTGSAGGGLSIGRARILVAFARRELRRQLDPGAVVVVKSSGRAVDDRAIERMTGHQTAHLAACAAAAGLLALAGVDLVGAIYTGISVLATHGPGIGAGPYGELSNFNGWARISLVPFMLAGRLSLVPLMIAIVWGVHARKKIGRSLRRRFPMSRFRFTALGASAGRQR